ncbi:hypothetical protein AQ490_26175 [Wenjunlia vitaminophila]|uniref:Amine oxidase domain-containing protein n=1 Tax=Wenjunlia vitaminophila TaxID=76728 RepID=A0A0T6LPV8_WENVI|nr:FAD-dependent oxidoreductase [Wenjunlia vitaminophila]KRV48155.1 hypothetical protein AQ490_26175 [Wenjunlia vitaminophila]
MTGVTVVGGGLAGMAAAWEIRKSGVPVRLLEASAELGGMSGSKVIEGRVEDHGVHIFPAWYRNTLHLVEELGITGNLRECDNFYQLMPGEFPTFRTFQTISSMGDLIRDIRSGVTPAADRMLFYYGIIDLLAQRYHGRDESLASFLRSRWYLTEAVIADLEHLFVASSAAEGDLASAASFRGSVAAFSQHPGKVRMPRGSLQESFIGPFRKRLEDSGVEVRTGVELLEVSVDGDRLDSLTVRAGDTVTEPVTGHVVLAVPHGCLSRLGRPVTSALRPPFGVDELRSRPLGALHLYLRRRLPGLPNEHVRLVGSPHAITLLDVGQVWDGHTTSVLNCVVGRVSRLAELSESEAVKVLVDELMSYMPVLTWDDIEHVCYQPHFAVPFYAPGPGSDRFRPNSSTALTNLHVAGDFCAGPPGMAGMEGAVRSGLEAAESVRRVLRPDAPRVPIRDTDPVNPSAARVGKVALAPVAAALRLLAGRRRAPRKGSR